MFILLFVLVTKLTANIVVKGREVFINTILLLPYIFNCASTIF